MVLWHNILCKSRILFLQQTNDLAQGTKAKGMKTKTKGTVLINESAIHLLVSQS